MRAWGDIRAELASRRQQDIIGLVERVARAHGVSAEEALLPVHYPEVVRARHAIWRAIWGDPTREWTLSRLGRLFGVDRTTITHALARTGGKAA